MALVSYVTNEEAPEKVKALFEGIEKKGQPVANFLRVLAHNPAMVDGFLALNATLPRTELDSKLRELAYLKTSELNDCSYCASHHREFGRKAGLSDRQVNETAQYQTSDAYDDVQRDVLRYAEEVTRTAKVSDELFDRLKQRLSERQLVELAMTVGLANLTNRITGTLRLELP